MSNPPITTQTTTANQEETRLSNRQTKYLEELITRLQSTNNAIPQYNQQEETRKPNKNNLIQSITKKLIINSPHQQHQQIQHINTIADQIRSFIQQDPNQSPDAPQRFTSLLTRLSSLPHPREKPATLKFLLALAPHLNTQNPLLNSSSLSTSPPILERLDPPVNDRNSNQNSLTKSAAEKLRLYRSQYGYPAHIPEPLILRDMIYLLQGIDGQYAYFKQSNNDEESWEEGGIGFNEPNSKEIISAPQRDLILKLTELGWLYKKINYSISNYQNISGMIHQAFAFALKEELGMYYRAIAIIESHLASSSETNLTSKALLLHLNPTALRLRMSAALISATKGTKGGQMISVLHSYTDHGDPVVHLFTSNLLEKVSVPWFKTLVSWMWDGELVDPMEEFFIRLNPAFISSRDSIVDLSSSLSLDGWNVWQKKFSFKLDMIPSFISESFARKIFSTGKSLNFIRHSCGDQEWHETRSEIYKASSKASLHYKDITGFKQTIDSTYSIATQKLFEIFFIKLKLLSHLKAVKDYLLLGRGDFISILIETLGPSLNKPANTLYRHNLTATLESAIRATTNDPDLINRLDVRMLEFNSFELGWDVFILEYKTLKPLDVLMSASAMEKYIRMFRILWKMKRLEYVLDKTWKILTLGVKRSLKNYFDLNKDFHKSRLVISEMIHFIRQIQSYCHLEVIDCGWQEFEKKLMSEGGDLDSLIEGHDAYLDRLISKGMLLSTRSGKENACLLLVEECFKVILAFKDSIDALYAYGLTQSARNKVNQISSTTKTNKYKYRDTDMEDSDDSDENFNEEEEENLNNLDAIRFQISSQSKLFTDLVMDLISVLSTQQDSDMKFLAVRLNFSLFYLRSKTSLLSISNNLSLPPPPPASTITHNSKKTT